MPRVSVIVPVYNGGEYLERCAPSLLEQSLPSTAYEVIYVDDGSTDDSLLRLHRLAADHPHVRVVSQENSGWPGKPRNVGLRLSEADYVQFVDQDDELAPEALERLLAVAEANDSDIVLGKLGGGMAGPNPAFRRSVAGGRLVDVPAAVETLTGHKMFRRAFLREHDVWFPEGYWRMEDLLFVVRAYSHDPRLSVVADYPCYWWHRRDDGGNNSTAAFDLADHYQRLRVIIATVLETPQPAAQRDLLLERLYRVETLSRVRENVVTRGDDTWPEAFELLSAVAREAVPDSIDDRLPALPRLRAQLVRGGDLEGTRRFVTRLAALKPVIQRRGLRIAEGGALQISLDFRLTTADGDPVRLHPGPAGGWVLDHRLTEDLTGVDPYAVPDPLAGGSVELQLEDAERHLWWYPAGSLAAQLVPADPHDPSGDHQAVVQGRLVVDPATAADGHPLAPGLYTVWFSGQLLGLNRRRRIVVPKAVRATLSAWTVCAGADLAVRPVWGEDLKLQLEVVTLASWREGQPAPEPEPEPASPAPEPGRGLGARLRRALGRG
ncbi:MAG: glycosyl transferase [Friedmanniella sp.]|nr:glycosyl transferase [Friedmanniella sp.]